MCCGGIIEDVFEGLTDIIEGIGGAVTGVISDVADVVTTTMEDVGEIVTDTVENVMSDPVAMITLGVSLALPGLGTAIGTAFGATGATATTVGNAVMRGVMAEATGGDFAKSALTSVVGAGFGQYAGDVGAALGIEDTVVQKAVGSTILKAGAAAATGKDVSNALIEGAITGAFTVAKDSDIFKKDIAGAIDPQYSGVGVETTMPADLFPVSDINPDIGTDWSPVPEPLPNVDTPSIVRTTDLTGKDILGAFGKAAGVAAAGKVAGKAASSLMRKSSTPTTFSMPTPSADREIYRDAPIKGYKMLQYEDVTGVVKYIPSVNGKTLIPVPSGFKPKRMAKGGFISRRS